MTRHGRGTRNAVREERQRPYCVPGRRRRPDRSCPDPRMVQPRRGGVGRRALGENATTAGIVQPTHNVRQGGKRPVGPCSVDGTAFSRGLDRRSAGGDGRGRFAAGGGAGGRRRWAHCVHVWFDPPPAPLSARAPATPPPHPPPPPLPAPIP